MSKKNQQSRTDTGKGKALQTCPVCGGSGKVSRKRDDTDICGFDSEKPVCPLCHGGGKIKSRRRLVRIYRRYRSKKTSPRKPGPGRNGRPSLCKVVLLQPGTPLSGWAEGDGVPKTELTPGFAQLHDHSPVEYASPEPPDETILKLSDSITITLGVEFPPDLVLDTDFVETNFLEPFVAGSGPMNAEMHYGVLSTELEAARSQRRPEPNIQGYIIDHGNNVFSLLLDDTQPAEPPEAHISKYEIGLSVDFKNELSVPGLTLQPDQSLSTTFTDVLPPEMFEEPNQPNIPDLEDPTGLQLDTDILGDIF